MKEQDTGRRPSVSTRPPDLLIIGFHTSRDVEMDHQPDVRLIDAHAEGIRRSENSYGSPTKVVMDELPRLIRKTGMVIPDRLMRLSQPFCDLFYRSTRGAIDQNGAGIRLMNQPRQCFQFFLTGMTETDRQGKISATESGNQPERIAER